MTRDYIACIKSAMRDSSVKFQWLNIVVTSTIPTSMVPGCCCYAIEGVPISKVCHVIINTSCTIRRSRPDPDVVSGFLCTMRPDGIGSFQSTFPLFYSTLFESYINGKAKDRSLNLRRNRYRLIQNFE